MKRLTRFVGQFSWDSRMFRFSSRALGAVIGCCLMSMAAAQSLPQGNTGIAARYPADAGIAADPGVIFFDDFESYGSVSALTGTGRWDQAFQTSNIRFATGAGNFVGGSKSVEFTLPQTSGEVSNELNKFLNPAQDTVFVRFYGKFDSAFNVMGSSHNGAFISASYWDGPGSGPGIPADGYNKFLVSYEGYRDSTATANPGSLEVYVYHPEQRDIWGDIFYPTGRVLPFDRTPGNFGPNFVVRPEIIPQLGRWYSYEVMVKANTPGQRDGRIALWLDGALIADFPNMRLRDTSDLKIDRVGISLHGNGGILATSKKWYDNVVIAKSYIGPMSSGAAPPPTPLPAPTNLRVQ
jgi:hypothetical protein